MPSIQIKAKGASVRVEGKEYTGKQCSLPIDNLVKKLGQDPSRVEPEWKPDALTEEHQETVAE